MWNWLARNSEQLGGLGAIVTALAAIVAIIVIPLQIRSADVIQQDQTAREIYREFLNLTVQKPEVASADYCAIKDDAGLAAYEAYVDYLLYTTEQMMALSPDWQDTMASYLSGHMSYLCADEHWQQNTEGVVDILQELRENCSAVQSCSQG